MKRILPVIVLAQFFCTSIWFALNAVMAELSFQTGLDNSFLAHFTSAIQLGFILGTLVFALLTISDRFSPSKVFFICAILAALLNLGIGITGISTVEMLVFRFLTGFFLAGIYPVGMKLAADHFEKGLGTSLGYLVGALVLGKSFPHLLKSFTVVVDWHYVLYSTSLLCIIGGLAVLLFVPNGPYRVAAQKPALSSFLIGFKKPAFKQAAFGYFGHMWELYAFWAFLPLILLSYQKGFPAFSFNVSFYTFLIIAAGTIACILGGYLSAFFGVKRTATIALLLSCMCCLTSSFLLSVSSFPLLIGFMVFWGMVVVADSPLFSTLVARNAPPNSRGSSLTIVNCIGFSITIISIQLLELIRNEVNEKYIFTFLAIGPVCGLLALNRKLPVE